MTVLDRRMAAAIDRLGSMVCEPVVVGRLIAFDGLMIEASGLDLPVGAGALVRHAGDPPSLAEVVGFRGGADDAHAARRWRLLSRRIARRA